MRVVALLTTLIAGASAFGVVPSTTNSRSTALFGTLPVESQNEAYKTKAAKAQRWKQIRLLSDEEAQAQLSGEELEAYTRYHSEIKADMEKMYEIAKLIQKDLEPPKIPKKSKAQKNRDRFALQQKREAARAAMK